MSDHECPTCGGDCDTCMPEPGTDQASHHCGDCGDEWYTDEPDEEKQLGAMEIYMLIRIAAMVHDEDILDEGTSPDVLAAAAKASRLVEQGYVPRALLDTMRGE